jgi:hypothetical protein
MQRHANSKDYVERRKHKRFIIRDVAFAILRTGEDEELGQIANISMGGLAFQYFVGNRELQKADRLDVLLFGQWVSLSMISAFMSWPDCELITNCLSVQ